jgi:hypothetical protein
MIKSAVILVSLLLPTFVCKAVSFSILPNDIQDRISYKQNSIPALNLKGSSYSTYSFSEDSISDYLFEYHLSLSSNKSGSFASTQLSATAWLSTQSTNYLNDERYFFILSLDSIAPAPATVRHDTDSLDLHQSISSHSHHISKSYIYTDEDTSSNLFTNGGLRTHGILQQVDNDKAFNQCPVATYEILVDLQLLYMHYLPFRSEALPV